MATDGFDQPSGLADRVDDLLLRVEGWSDRSRSAIATVAVIATVLLLGWWLTRPVGSGEPVEDRIPRAAAPVGVVSTIDGPMVTATGPEVPGPSPAIGSDPSGASEAGAEDPASDIVVHVVGEVTRPGLVSLEPGARISDAVDAAGGPLETAEVERLNLATPVIDGMQIRVPAVGELEGDEGGGDGHAGGGASLVRLPDTPAPASPEQSDPQPGPVDLNRAGAGELESLPGVGPSIAGAIVAWREDNDGFATVDDLLEVPGIGPAKLAALRDRVVV